MLSAQESAVLEVLFEASTSPQFWPDMLHALAQYLQAGQCQLFTPAGMWDHHGPADSPLPDNLTGLRLGRVYTGEELLDRALQGGLPQQASDLRAIGLRAQQGACWLMLSRQRGEFRAVDSAALAAIAPHVTQAIDLAVRHSSNKALLDRATGLARRLGVGVLEFDHKGNCTAQDTIARDLLGQAGITAAQLSAAQGRVQRISETLELLFPVDAPKVAYLRHSAQNLPDAALIAQALGISLSEARLARALGMGDSLSQAAARLGLTVETARAYSKQIFAKTGLRGQPDLMRKLWTGALPLC